MKGLEGKKTLVTGGSSGIGAAITGFISTLMAVPISTFIGKFVANTTLPVFIGFLICGALSIIVLHIIKLHAKNKELKLKQKINI